MKQPNQERILQINSAMEKASGNKDLAAALLNMRPSHLSQEIRLSKDLHARWADRRTGLKQQVEPKETETLARPNVAIDAAEVFKPPTEAELQIASEILKEDQMLAKGGFEGLGLTPDELALANEFAAYGHGHTVDTIHVITASNTRMVMKLQTQMAEIEKRLEQVRAKLRSPWLEPVVTTSEKGVTTVFNPRRDYVREEAALHHSHTAMGLLLARMFDISQRAVLLQAMMRYRGKQGTLPKPGFAPFDHANGRPAPIGNGGGKWEDEE